MNRLHVRQPLHSEKLNTDCMALSAERIRDLSYDVKIYLLQCKFSQNERKISTWWNAPFFPLFRPILYGNATDSIQVHF